MRVKLELTDGSTIVGNIIDVAYDPAVDIYPVYTIESVTLGICEISHAQLATQFLPEMVLNLKMKNLYNWELWRPEPLESGIFDNLELSLLREKFRPFFNIVTFRVTYSQFYQKMFIQLSLEPTEKYLAYLADNLCHD